MTVRDVLDAMDDEVWVRVRPCTPGHQDDDLVVWSADWLAGGEGDPGIPDGLARYLDCEADDMCIETCEDPEYGDEAPMLVVCAYNSNSAEKKGDNMGETTDNKPDLARWITSYQYEEKADGSAFCWARIRVRDSDWDPARVLESMTDGDKDALARSLIERVACPCEDYFEDFHDKSCPFGYSLAPDETGENLVFESWFRV